MVRRGPIGQPRLGLALPVFVVDAGLSLLFCVCLLHRRRLLHVLRPCSCSFLNDARCVYLAVLDGRNGMPVKDHYFVESRDRCLAVVLCLAAGPALFFFTFVLPERTRLESLALSLSHSLARPSFVDYVLPPLLSSFVVLVAVRG